MSLRFLRIAAAVLALSATATSARAEIIVLTSGRTISVKSHRVQGETIVLTLRTGGEVTCDKSLIEKILSDEIPHPEPQTAADQSGAGEPPDQAPDAEALPMGPYGEIIMSMAETHGVDPMLVRALIRVESGDQPTARSHKGAMGLMQLMPATAAELGVSDPYDPVENIRAGVIYLKHLLAKYAGDVALALAAYNAGHVAVVHHRGIPPYPQTRAYVNRILRQLERSDAQHVAAIRWRDGNRAARR